MRTLVTDVVKSVSSSPEVTYKASILPHTTSVKNRFRRADFCQLLLKEKPFFAEVTIDTGICGAPNLCSINSASG